MDGQISTTTLKLILDVFVTTPNDVEIHVNAFRLNGALIGHMEAFTQSKAPMRRNSNGEYEFDISGSHLTIRNLEVARPVQRIGIGRRMTSLLLGQARAYGMVIAEVGPWLDRIDRKLMDGRDGAALFWKDIAFV